MGIGVGVLSCKYMNFQHHLSHTESNRTILKKPFPFIGPTIFFWVMCNKVKAEVSTRLRPTWPGFGSKLDAVYGLRLQ